MKKGDVRQTSEYRQMAHNVFGEFQAAWDGKGKSAAEQKTQLREMHEETMARIGQPTTPRAKTPARQKSLVLGTKPRAKRTTGSKGK